jgi:hypothetical protein
VPKAAAKPEAKAGTRGAAKAGSRSKQRPEPKNETKTVQKSDPKASGKAEPAAATTVELLDNLRERRGRRTPPVSPADDDAGDPIEDLLDSLSVADLGGADVGAADLGGTGYEHDPGPNHPAHRAGAVSGGRNGGRRQTSARDEPATAVLPPPVVAAGSGGAAPLGASASFAPVVRRPRRASVPSWDDIVFGSRRD